jgi:hypothetical protein
MYLHIPTTHTPNEEDSISKYSQLVKPIDEILNTLHARLFQIAYWSFQFKWCKYRVFGDTEETSKVEVFSSVLFLIFIIFTCALYFFCFWHVILSIRLEVHYRILAAAGMNGLASPLYGLTNQVSVNIYIEYLIKS